MTLNVPAMKDPNAEIRADPLVPARHGAAVHK
jgi:hypothetical protein